MNRKTLNQAHIGAASVMLIFMVLSLVSFATLTLVGSRADMNLTAKMYDRSLYYSKACHEANAFIAEISTRLNDAYRNSTDDISYMESLSETTFSKNIYLTDYQTLDVTIEAVSPSDNGGKLYKITSYKITTHDEKLILDEHLPVIR